MGEDGECADVVVLQSRPGRLSLGGGDGAVLPEVGERSRFGRVQLVNSVEGTTRFAVGLHGPRRSTVAAARRCAARGGALGAGRKDVTRVLVLMHVQDHVNALLSRPADHLRDAGQVGRRVRPRRRFQLAPVEDEADDVKAQGAHLGEVVTAAGSDRLREGRPRGLYLAERGLGNQWRGLGAPTRVGRGCDRKQGRFPLRFRVRHVLHADRGGAVEQHFAPCSVGQEGRAIATARRRDHVEEGQRLGQRR